MKLESTATKGRDVLKLDIITSGDTLDTTQMLLTIFESRDKHSKADLAYSAHTYLARGLATMAVERASENGVKNVGFSGGVACNAIFQSTMRRVIEAANLRFLVHEAIPPGDGGLSFGQIVASGFSQF
jgi:hydrogenase maturation protein HypF